MILETKPILGVEKAKFLNPEANADPLVDKASTDFPWGVEIKAANKPRIIMDLKKLSRNGMNS